MLHKLVLTSESVDQLGQPYCVTIQLKATGHCLPVGVFIMLRKVVITFGSEDELLQCCHSNESY